MKLKTYRIIDLTVLCVLAFGIELMATYCVNAFIHGIRPFPVLGMLLTLVAITRWGIVGTIIIPINTLANFLIGRFAIVSINYRETYDFLSLIFTMISTSSILISFAWFKKKGRTATFKEKGSMLSMIGCAIIINLILCVLFSSIYYISAGTSALSAKDVGARIIGMLLYNAFGYFITIFGSLILCGQGIFVDVKQSLIDRKKEKTNEDLYYSKKQDEKK